MKLTQPQIDLLKVLNKRGAVYAGDDQLAPFWDQTGGEPHKPDILEECYRRGLIKTEGGRFDDLISITASGRRELHAVGQPTTTEK